MDLLGRPRFQFIEGDGVQNGCETVVHSKDIIGGFFVWAGLHEYPRTFVKATFNYYTIGGASLHSFPVGPDIFEWNVTVACGSRYQMRLRHTDGLAYGNGAANVWCSFVVV